eukprot:543364-Pyramimonas_sp.AAC.1
MMYGVEVGSVRAEKVLLRVSSLPMLVALVCIPAHIGGPWPSSPRPVLTRARIWTLTERRRKPAPPLIWTLYKADANLRLPCRQTTY